MTELLKKFLKVSENIEDKIYLFYTITYNIAPTLGAYKPATILTFTKDNRNLYELWKKYKNEYLEITSLNIFELRDNMEMITVLFYDDHNLKYRLFKKESMEFLRLFGYSNDMNLNECLNLLKRRHDISCPHEMGIFLGIPIKDVREFIGTSGRNCITCGYWKVYYDKEEAIMTFDIYNKIKEKVLKLFFDGMEIEAIVNIISYGESIATAG